MQKIITVLCGLWLVGLSLPLPAQAAPPDNSDQNQCGDCHEVETVAWENSPHANAIANGETAATCVDCHGPYVEDHPEAGYMQLTVDSSSCQQCHANTFTQWQNTTHAGAGVQCIGCHMSHSQQARLSDDRQCESCHRDRQADFEYTAHGLADVNCTDCHVTPVMPETNVSFIGTLEKTAAIAPDHDFTHVSPQNCLDCHTEEAHNGLPPSDAAHVAQAKLVDMAESVPVLSDRLTQVEQSNRTLMIAVPVTLGIGLGMGGAIGIIFMMFLAQRQRRNS
jgi:hypothetical protein